MMNRKLAYAILNVAVCGINVTDKVIMSDPTDTVVAARNVVFRGTATELMVLSKLLMQVYDRVYGDDVPADYYVRAIDYLSDDDVAVKALNNAMEVLAEDKWMKNVLMYPFDAVKFEALMDDVDTAWKGMCEVLDALQLINHHVKDLKHIRDWLWVCECPKERYLEFKNQMGYRSSLDNLDQVALGQYGVELNAASNRGYGVLDSMPIIGFDDEAEYCIEDDSADFIYPEGDLDKLNQRISKDYDYIYALKDICIRYLLFNAEKENVTAKVVAREIGEDDRKLIGVEITVGNKSYKFHNRSEEFFDLHSEIPIDTNAHKAKFRIYNFEKSEVTNALKKIEDFCKSRNIRLPKREVI